MGYCDTTDTEIIALTRQRRADRARLRSAREIHESLSFPEVARHVLDPIEATWRKREDFHVKASITWKREQWEAGNRHCGYCGMRTTRDPNTDRTCTVDHRKPRAFGGRDVPENWIIACNSCNWRKATMSESMFRALIASENTPRARRLAE